MMTSRQDMPDHQDISRLARWAQVALAARAARRMQWVFASNWPDAPAEKVRDVERAIHAAERAAATASCSENMWGVARGAGMCHNAAVCMGLTRAGAAARAAAGAALSAMPDEPDEPPADLPPGTQVISIQAPKATDAVRDALHAAADACDDPSLRESLRRAVWRDYETLLRWARVSSDATPLPVDSVGPLWPEGEPAHESDARPEMSDFDPRNPTPEQAEYFMRLVRANFNRLGRMGL